MAKHRTAAQKAATKRMQKGLRRWKARHRRRARPRRRSSGPRRMGQPARIARRRPPTSHYRRRPSGATTVELAPITMAELVRNPRRKKRRKNPMARKRRRHTKRSNPRRYRRRSSPGRRHHRRRRNPGLGGPVRSIVKVAIPAGIGGLAAGFLDSKISGNWPMLMRLGAKVVAGGVGGALLRRNPLQAAAFMGSMIGSAGYEGGVRLGGGVIATSKGQGMRELAAMAAEDEESLGLLAEELQGMGLLTEMGDDDDGMGDDEPDLGDVEPDLGDEDEIGDDDDD